MLEDCLKDVDKLDVTLGSRLRLALRNERPISVEVNHQLCQDFVRDVYKFIEKNTDTFVILYNEDGRMIKIGLQSRNNSNYAYIPECNLGEQNDI